MEKITSPAIKRLARRAGVKRIGALVFQEMRRAMAISLENLTRGANMFKNNDKRVTYSVKDVKNYLSSKGTNVLFYSKTSNVLNFKTYIRRILKTFHPNARIKESTIIQINQMLVL